MKEWDLSSISHSNKAGSTFRFRIVPLGWRETFSEFKTLANSSPSPSLT